MSAGKAETSVPAAALERLTPTIGLEEAAQLLRVSTSHLRRKARVGKVPGAKIGRQWVFVRADLLELIREQARERTGRPIDVRALRTANPFERSASQLALQIKSERRNFKPRQLTAQQKRRP